MNKAKAVATKVIGLKFKSKELLEIRPPDVDDMADVFKTQIKSFPDDSDDLYNTKMKDGYRDLKNIKVPFLGENEVDEKSIQTAIFKDSELLLEIVQECEYEETRLVIDLMHAHPENSVPIPYELLSAKNGSEIRVRLLKVPGKGNMEEDSNDPFPDSLKKPLAFGWKREVRLEGKKKGGGEVIYTAPTGETFSTLKEIDLYLKKNPSENWSLEDFSFLTKPSGLIRTKKEVAVTPKKAVKKGRVTKASVPAKRVGQAKGSPAVQIKPNTTRRAIQPPKRYATGETQFHPEKKSRPAAKPVAEEAMTMGMLPPRYNMNSEETSPPGGNSDLKKRGRPPKSKLATISESPPDSEYQQTMYENFDNEGEEGDGLFQISALQYSDSLLHQYERDGYAEMMAEMQEMVDLEKEYEFKAPRPPVKILPKPASQSTSNPMVQSVTVSVASQGKKQQGRGGGRPNQRRELLPCSIRCPGMTGEVPSLQCKRCLCLYHPRCIGLPANLPFLHFLCSNCEAKGARIQDEVDVPMEMIEECSLPPPPPPLARTAKPESPPKKWSLPTLVPPKMVGPFNMRRSTDNSGFQSIGQGGMSVKRLDTVTSRNPIRGVGPGRQSIGRGGMKVPSGGAAARPKTTESSGMSISPVKRTGGTVGGQTTKGPSKLVVPQLSRTFTIAPISIPIKGPKPQVPDLSQRILNLNSGSFTKSRLGSFENRGFNRAAGQSQWMTSGGGGKLAKGNNSGGGMIPHIPKKVGSPPKTVNLTNGPEGPKIVPKWQSGIRKLLPLSKNPSLPRYPQKVISLGGKKLIVVNRPPKVRSKPTATVTQASSTSLLNSNSTSTPTPTSE